MVSFPREIVLGIAECLDTKSLFKLMMVNKQLYELITQHQRSVSLRLVSDFVAPPVGNVFSSEVFMRRVIPHGTFAMALEMEKRNAHIEAVLDSDFFTHAIPGRLESLTPEQEKRFRVLTKKAIAQCDCVADIAANFPCHPIAEMWYGRLKGPYFEPRDLPLGFRIRDPYSNIRARQSQREYLFTLSKEDIAMIYFVLTTLSWGFYLDNFTLANADTTFPERQVIFKECVLRHGSWFAWGHIRGDDPWEMMTEQMMRLGWAELVSFELGGENAPASLHSTLAERFDDLFMPTDQSDPDNVMQSQVNILNKTVKDLVTGVSDEKPAEKKPVEDEVVEEVLEGLLEQIEE
ncbi:hypothetical protein F4781DRAFT_67863 [Annulohypoxylon bovei var. microspora]|nr:hypothetical protein F4781DRAFT_67863 [Annulohypoxylon bovei var. microspora]